MGSSTPPTVVVGSGIIGLSVAEALSRGEAPVYVVSNDHPLSASPAAPATLSLKGQQFGRHPHFQWKIEGFKRMQTWLTSLVKEGHTGQTLNHQLYVEGEGLVHFSTEATCERQWHRTLQDPQELTKRGLLPQKQWRRGPTTVSYGQEGWVHGGKLLALLRAVLDKRAVPIVTGDATCQHTWEQLPNKTRAIILCAGAWTPLVLAAWEVPWQPPGTPRLTAGSTWFWPHTFPHVPHPYIEFWAHAGGRCVWSGGSHDSFLSSTTAKLENWEDLERGWEHENTRFWKNWSDSGPPPPFSKIGQSLHGLRIGFGHSELAIENLGPGGWFNSPIVVCAGAHKSGYLLAPIVGDLVLKAMDEPPTGGGRESSFLSLKSER